MPNLRTIAIVVAMLVLLLSISFMVRTYLARERCQSLGLVYQPGQGCISPEPERPVILQRDLQRT
ncbi:MAG: hypothetical protein ACK4MF_03560 [Hyphomicrobiaceae bacterium]